MVTEAFFKRAVQEFGEVFVVMDSGHEYIIHGERGYEMQNGFVEAKGMKGDEYVIVNLFLDDVEHIYTHKEL